MAWPVLLITCLSFVAGLKVTPIPDGILVKRGTEIRIKTVEWKVVVTIQDIRESMRKDILEEINVLQEFLDTRLPRVNSLIRRDHWKNELERATMHLTHLNRQKRSLLPVFGKIAEALFGTATEEEVLNLQAKVKENRKLMNGIVHYQNDLLTVINATHNDMMRNRDTMNHLINATQELQEWYKQLTTTMGKEIQGLINYNLVAEKMFYIWEHIRVFKHAVSQYNAQRYALEHGRLQENILPRKILLEVASQQSVPGTETLPPEWYYANVKIHPLWKQDILSYFVILPLVDSSPYVGYEVQTFPIPLQNSSTMVKILATGTIALDTRSGSVFTAEGCSGRAPLVCNPTPIHKNDELKGCVHAIAMKKDVSSVCEVKVIPSERSHVYPGVSNHVIVSTWQEDIMEHCPSGVERLETLTLGAFIVEWQGDCILSTDTWSISGVVTRETKRVVSLGWQTLSGTEEIKLHDLVQEPLKHDIKIPGQVPMPRVISLKPLKELPSVEFSEVNHEYYHLFWLVLLVIIAIVVVLVYLYIKRKSPAIEISPPTHEETTQQPYVPHFHFSTPNQGADDEK